MKHIKNFENNNLEVHLMNSIDAGRVYKVKELIENKDVDKNFQNKYGRTPLIMSIILAKPEIVKYLIGINVNLNLQDNRGRTALMYAAENSLRSYDMLCDIIDGGANWDIKDYDGKDFIELMLFSLTKNRIINKYPEKYEEYLAKKNAEKYNL